MNITEVVEESTTDYVSPVDYDGLWKKIIKDLFEEFMLFFAPDLYDVINFAIAPEFLDKELYKEIIETRKGKNIADQIVKVHMKNGEDKWILIHAEVQGRDEDDFSERMFRYFYRTYDKFERKVYAIALLTSDNKPRYPDAFHYDFYGTTVDYKYKVYKFYEHEVSELEKLDNPFAYAVIAGKYANKAKNNAEQRYRFKVHLMKQIIRNFPEAQGRSRLYITALFYFIDYLLKTPQEYGQKIRSEVMKEIKQEGGEYMKTEREILSPTLAGIVKELSKGEMEMAKRSGIEEGREVGRQEGRQEGRQVGRQEEKIGVAKKLIRADFGDEQISELTGLSLEEVVELRKSL